MLTEIPEDALKSHIAILGKTGSGKSNLAKQMVVYLAGSRLGTLARVVVIDPTGTWWGLRLDADGTGPGPLAGCPIIGGDHGDIPLDQSMGEALGKLIGMSQMDAIIDTRSMTVGHRTWFFADFAEALLMHNRGPLHLIIDEAHLFAPQGRVSDPASARMVHAANNLISLGRAHGLRITLISQRAAKVHKDSLTQVETLIAMRLIAPQDTKVVKDWIGEWADQKQAEEILSSLASLPTGEGWLWSPEIGVLDRISPPLVAAFDTGQPHAHDTALPAVDVKAIREALKPAQPNPNPAPITQPTSDSQKPSVAKTKTIRPAPGANPEIDAIEFSAHARGRSEGFAEGKAAGHTEGYLEGIAVAKREAEHLLKRFLPWWEKFQDLAKAQWGEVVGELVTDLDILARLPETHPSRREARGEKVERTKPDFSDPADEALDKPKAGATTLVRQDGSAVRAKTTDPLLVRAVRHWPAKLTWGQLATLEGRKARGGHFNTAKKRLIDSELVREEGDAVVPTDKGFELAGGKPNHKESVIDAFLEALPGPADRMLAAIIEFGEDMIGTGTLSAMLRLEPRGGHWNTGLATLERCNLITRKGGELYPNRAIIKKRKAA